MGIHFHFYQQEGPDGNEHAGGIAYIILTEPHGLRRARTVEEGTLALNTFALSLLFCRCIIIVILFYSFPVCDGLHTIPHFHVALPEVSFPLSLCTALSSVSYLGICLGSSPSPSLKAVAR